MDIQKEIVRDIANRTDIEFLMNAFYTKALKNSEIGPFFTEIAAIDLESHLPHIVDFWEQQLFYTGTYKKNVLQIHQNLSAQKMLETIHFDTWLSLFITTINQFFKGEKSELMKTRALSIATVIKLKIS